MESVVLVIHLMVALAIIGLVLIQRSEGGGLGMGSSGGGMGNFMTPRRTADLLTRTTSILAAVFFCTSILLAILANNATSKNATTSILDAAPAIEKSVTDDKTGENAETPVKEPAETIPAAPASE